jgi:hypothetical protein
MDRESPLRLTTLYPIALLTSGNEQEVAAMKIGGNQRANAIFEASGVYISIKPRSDQSSRMAFVQEKYMSRNFYDASHYSFCVQEESSSPLKAYDQYEPRTPKGSKPLLSYEDLFKAYGSKEEEEDEDIFGEAPYNGSLMDADKPQGNDSSTAPTLSLEDDDDGDMFADSKTTTSELFGSSTKYQKAKLTKAIEGGLLCFLEKEEKPFGVINFAPETTSPKKSKTKTKAKIGEPFGDENCFSTRSPKKKGRSKVKAESEEWTQFAPFGGGTQVREKIEEKKPNYENNSRWRKKLSDCSDRKDRRSEVRNALNSLFPSDDEDPEITFRTPKQDPKQRASWTSSPAARSAPNTSKRRNTYNGSRRSGIKSVPSSPRFPLTPEVDALGFEVAEQTKKRALASALEPQVDDFGFTVPSLSVLFSTGLRSRRKSIQPGSGQKIDPVGVADNTGTPNSVQATKRALTRQPSLQNFLLKDVPQPFIGSVGMKTGETGLPRALSRRSASRRDSGVPSQDAFLSTESSGPDSIGIQTGEPAPRRTSRPRSSRREFGSASSLNDSCSSAMSAGIAVDVPAHGEIPSTSSPRRRGATDLRRLETPPALTPSRRSRVRSSPPLAPSPTRSPQGVDDLAESGTLTPTPRRRLSKSRHDLSGHRRSERSPWRKLEDTPPTPSRRRARESALKLPL